MDFARMLYVMRDIAVATGNMLCLVQGSAKRKHVPRKDFVTAQDHASEEMIMGQLKEFFPKIPVFAEESGGEELKEGPLFVVDPLDGTVNYYYQDDFWGISIGLVKDGRPFLGAIYLPATKASFVTTPDLRSATAERTEGKAKLTIKLKMSVETDLSEARVWIDPGKDDPMFPCLRRALETHSLYPQTRLCATASMMQLATGKIDGYVLKPQPEDIVAAIPIIERAGGKVTNLCGEPFDIFSRNAMVASNGNIHNELVDVLNKGLARL